MDSHGGRSAGFTLIELMLTIGVGAIVSTTVFGSMLYQQQLSLKHIESTEAQQNARIALDVVKRYVRQAGWGLPPNATVGVPAIGTCSSSEDEYDCNNLDGGSDRIRLSMADPERGFFFGSPDSTQPGVNGNLQVAPTSDANGNAVPDPFGGGFTQGTMLMITGKCEGEEKVATDIIRVHQDNPDHNRHHKINYKGPGFSHLSCSSGYADGFSIGFWKTVDIYIDKTTDPAHPTLMLDLDGAGSDPAIEVAYDVEDLQIEYGLDTTATPDGLVDEWCDDPRLSTCATGLANDRANLSRIIAVDLAVVGRSRDPDPIAIGSITDDELDEDLLVQDHTIEDDDGYVRWVFRTRIKLKNRVFSS